MSTLYEFAGREEALHRLEEMFYASVLLVGNCRLWVNAFEKSSNGMID
jgi:truncated hemoglobin YjbI